MRQPSPQVFASVNGTYGFKTRPSKNNRLPARISVIREDRKFDA
jgi:hypothetical protein